MVIQVLPETGSANLDEGTVEMPFETETIEDIQNEITSAILVARPEHKQAFQFDQSPLRNLASGLDNSGLIQGNKICENQSQNEEIGTEMQGEGSLLVDENRSDDRKRNSTKR